jgi:hypothetical protein
METRKLDSDRNTRKARDMSGKSTTLYDFGTVTARIDATGEYVELPVRMTLTGKLGIGVEVGPLSLSINDSKVLASILDEINNRADWSES